MHFKRKISIQLLCILLSFGLELSSAQNGSPGHSTPVQFPVLASWVDQIGIPTPASLGCYGVPKLPSGMRLRSMDFQNWSERLRVPNLWTVEPSHPLDVVELVNWAYKHNYTVRARGFMHSWAPLTVTADVTSCNKILLVDTIKHLTRMSILEADSDHPVRVSVQTGASWENLLTYLETYNYGVFSFPAVGQMSIGGTLAVGAHGTGLPTTKTRISDDFRTGSISDLIYSLDAVVWDPSTEKYMIKTFYRDNEDTRAFLVHLGRAFLTQVTLVVGKNYNLRCQSITDIKASVLFGADVPDNKDTLGTYVELYDRVEAQFFPYTDKAWLKLWTEEPTKSRGSTTINKPYPYRHGNAVSRPLDRLIQLLASGVTRLAPVISRMTYELGVSAVSFSGTADVWGPSKNSLLYYHTMAHKFISLGYTVLTTRANIQKVVHKTHYVFSSLTENMSASGNYPMNQPLEFRITGLDKTRSRTTVRNGNESVSQNIRPPSLSFLSEVEGHPEYDVAIFLGLHYFPGTPNAAKFMQSWEYFLFSNFNGQYATARVEWAKTWGFDGHAPWTNATVYRQVLPKTFGSEWNWAINKLNEYDPHYIYSNPFLKELMSPIST